MPTYDYRCEACGHEFERVQRISEDPIKECPSCHQQRAKRQLSQGNFILKGSGWYSDLYSGSSNKKGGGSSASSSSSTTAASTSSDSSSTSSSGSTTSSTSTSSTSSGSGGSASAAATTAK